MRLENFDNGRRMTILPGEYYVAADKIIISTLLGSCVSACLYDPYTKIIGMNHFLLSSQKYSRDMPMCITEAGRYGIHSMELLINDMCNRGVKRCNLKAKAFGGASVLNCDSTNSSFFAVGDVNVRFIKEFLQDERIPLMASDLGGTVGRVIHFHSGDYSVYVRKMGKTDKKLVQREEHYWKKTLQRQVTSDTQVDLWQ